MLCGEHEMIKSLEEDIKEMLECITKLDKVVNDMLPQIGKIVLQDYAALNEGLILSRKILNK